MHLQLFSEFSVQFIIIVYRFLFIETRSPFFLGYAEAPDPLGGHPLRLAHRDAAHPYLGRAITRKPRHFGSIEGRGSSVLRN